ncbi:MAG: phospholipid/cholesterol/gamma-HCH transport system substrate-binding protein [Acidobacteriaceae bacterium]|jgi:phospholipid/cholesterol/gamma-HCH transport system substrate-binding protein|nr:phospholipid/cholesterol/gamma-HCH transport system substrate-binding protein [Acidobacteriaceae bacterium]
MDTRREQALVGLFVIVAAAVLVATVFGITGAFGRTAKSFHAFFPFAGGLEVGSTVRYAGGPKVGRVEKLRIDPQNAANIEITLAVQSDLPVKTDSHVRIMSMSPLGDNHLEIVPGTPQAALAKDGATLPSDRYLDLNAITERINDLAPEAQQLLHTLNDRATELKVTIARVNDLLNDENRANLSGTLAQTHHMIAENRPAIKSTLGHLNTSSEKLGPLLDDLRKTSAEANKTLDHVDGLIGDNRADIREAVLQLRKALNNVTDLTGRIDQTLDVNSENIDEMLENFRHVSENLKQFTETIKTKPYTLLRASSPREHKTGEPK